MAEKIDDKQHEVDCTHSQIIAAHSLHFSKKMQSFWGNKVNIFQQVVPKKRVFIKTNLTILYIPH